MEGEYEIIDIVHEPTGWRPNWDYVAIAKIIQNAPNDPNWTPEDFPEDEHIFHEDGRMSTIIHTKGMKKHGRKNIRETNSIRS